jgi:hypothetical protein
MKAAVLPGADVTLPPCVMTAGISRSGEVNVMTCYSLSRRRSLGIHAGVFAMVCSAATAADQATPPLNRVRSNDPSIAAVIQQAAVRSPLFRPLIATIDATDGLVYVDEGNCGHSVSACLTLSVQVAGPYRLLRILVDPHKREKDCDLMASIGHEPRHAIELLVDPTVRNYRSAYSFFDRVGPTGSARFETPAAVGTGLEVGAEACAQTAATDASPISRVRSGDRSIISLIDRAAEQSPTFKQLLTAIASSNGIVYVERGNCGHGVRACLKMWMTISGPDRYLRIVVDRQKADSDADFMGSIGHELRHAIEALSQASIRDGAQLYNFFKRIAPTDNNRFETAAATDAGDAVRHELRVR